MKRKLLDSSIDYNIKFYLNKKFLNLISYLSGYNQINIQTFLKLLTNLGFSNISVAAIAPTQMYVALPLLLFGKVKLEDVCVQRLRLRLFPPNRNCVRRLSFLNNRNQWAGQRLTATGNYAVIESRLVTANHFSSNGPLFRAYKLMFFVIWLGWIGQFVASSVRG